MIDHSIHIYLSETPADRIEFQREYERGESTPNITKERKDCARHLRRLATALEDTERFKGKHIDGGQAERDRKYRRKTLLLEKGE